MERAFNIHEPRGEHTGKWIAAGQGLANHLHGKKVVGRHGSGKDVHGTYQGHGYVLPDDSGPGLVGGAAELAAFPEKYVGRPVPVKVTHVRPVRKRQSVADLLNLGQAAELAAFPEKYVGRTAETATASTVHEPLGKPGGPGLFKHKGWQLPAYIQHVATDLREKGKDESRAIAMAIGIVRNWSEGHDGKGNKVSAVVQAAATPPPMQRQGEIRWQTAPTPMAWMRPGTAT